MIGFLQVRGPIHEFSLVRNICSMRVPFRFETLVLSFVAHHFPLVRFWEFQRAK